MPAKVIACGVLTRELAKVIPPGMDLELMPYALHRTPDKLRTELQQRLDVDKEHDTIILAYGLCSGGTTNVSSPCAKLVIPRVHDCISILLGGRQAYEAHFNTQPGTIYLSQGWVENGGDPWSEYVSYEKQYGRDDAKWLIDTLYANYRQVMLINTCPEYEDRLRSYITKVATLLNVSYAEKPGFLNLLDNLINGPWDERFVVRLPGVPLRLHDFL